MLISSRPTGGRRIIACPSTERGAQPARANSSNSLESDLAGYP
jgi:hypothetical protein